MTDILQRGIPAALGTAKPTIEALTEVVNVLQGISDQDQRAVRMFEFEQRVAAVEARLKAAGL